MYFCAGKLVITVNMHNVEILTFKIAGFLGSKLNMGACGGEGNVSHDSPSVEYFELSILHVLPAKIGNALNIIGVV